MKFEDLKAVKELKDLAKKAPDLTQDGYLTGKRVSQMVASFGKWRLLYGTERVDDQILKALSSLASEAKVLEKMKRLQDMEVMNYVANCDSENRMVGHTAIRNYHQDSKTSKAAAEARSEFLREFDKLNHFIPKTKPFKSMIVVGIGGSYLGTDAVYHALKAYQSTDKKLYFASNVDPDKVNSILNEVDLKTTLVAIVSKSGGTLEIQAQEDLLRRKFSEAKLSPKDHFILVTGKNSPMDQPNKFLEVFYMRDYIGGRFSVSSVVGVVPLSFIFGVHVVEEFLKGLSDMDHHALVEKNPLKNLPLLAALIGIWNRNFLNYSTLAIVPYSQAMNFWSAHLQQLYMESNGKSVNQSDGSKIQHATCPVIWGTVGTEGQHAYYQCIHQGTDKIPLEFIGFVHPQRFGDQVIEGTTNQEKLNANMVAQAIALAVGEKNKNPNKFFEGNRPSHLLVANVLDPYTLGSLLAYHEHYVAFQGFIWGINSFDQEGVQLGKVLAKDVLDLYKAQREKGSMPKDKNSEIGRAFMEELKQVERDIAKNEKKLA
jgi:glucose-6-phosphate isomerase